MGAEHRHGARRPRRRVLVGEPTDGVAVHAALGHGVAHLGLDGAQVLADEHRSGPGRLHHRQVQQLGTVGVHIRAVEGVVAGRDAVEPEQAHDVVDAQQTAVVKQPTQGVDPRLVARGAQPPRHVRRQSPVLAQRTEVVGRGPDPTAQCEQVLVDPGIRAVGVEADGQVRHQLDVHPCACLGRVGQLAVAGGLDPPPPLDVVVQSDQSLGESGAAGMSGRRREPRPPSAVSFGQGRESSVVELERVCVGPGAPGVLGWPRRIVADQRPQLPQGL